jgi:N-acetylmuramoyl-L-alanine amidase
MSSIRARTTLSSRWKNRTRIANEEKADLFLSIHVNSSRYRAASGSETYYLNFTTSSDAWMCGPARCDVEQGHP